MPTEPKLDLFKPETPRIPGIMPVGSGVAEEPVQTEPSGRAMQIARKLVSLLWVILTIGGMVATGMGLMWWSRRSSNEAVSTPVPVTDLPAPHAAAAKPAEHVPDAPGEIATARELAKTWSAKRFSFRNAVTSELIPAVVVRLPSGELWGVALREPYGTCDLDYMTDLQKLKNDYHFGANHPMVVDTCTGAVFDLAVYGNGPNGLVRGEIVAGSGIRPPLAIKIETRGNEIFATRME